jgi:hypothetical protein
MLEMSQRSNNNNNKNGGSQQHVNKAYDITGSDALSHSHVAEILSSEVGKKISYIDVTEEQLLPLEMEHLICLLFEPFDFVSNFSLRPLDLLITICCCCFLFEGFVLLILCCLVFDVLRLPISLCLFDIEVFLFTFLTFFFGLLLPDFLLFISSVL